MLSEKRKFFIVATLIVAIGIFFVATIRSGHGWGDDFALYILHAKNIASGIPYQQTGYIYNPNFAVLGPQIYPPIFPLMLAPLYKIFGLDFTIFKIEIIFFLLAAFFFVYLVFRKELSFKYLLIFLIILGLNPYLWSFRNSILSDIPFLFFAFTTLFLIEQFCKGQCTTKNQWLYGGLLGFLTYLCFGTRTLGIVLLPVLFVYELIRFRRIRSFAIIAGLVFLFLAGAQTIILSDSGSYFDQFHSYGPFLIIKNFLVSAKVLILFWGTNIKAIVLGVIIALLALFGFILRLKEKKFACFDLFLIFYVLAIGFWPSHQGIRFLIPILPLFLFYVFYRLQKIGNLSKIPIKIRSALLILLLSAIFIAYFQYYLSLGFGHIAEGPFKKESIELFDYIKQGTDSQDVIIFIKPRALALFTGRSASAYHQTESDQELWQYFQKISADYLVQRKRVYLDDFLDDFITRNESILEPVYSNLDFVVYRIKP